MLARTDACVMDGFEAAIERAQKFSEVGAGLLFVEAVTTAAHIRALQQRLDKPQQMNMEFGGQTPIVGAEELAQLGECIVLYANAAFAGQP